MALEVSYLELTNLFRTAGLELLAVDSGEPLQNELEHLQSWQDAGFAAEMSYMKRDPQLLTTPQKLFPELESIFVFSLPYATSSRPPLDAGHGRVARYAWGRDYHVVSKERVASLLKILEQQFGAAFKYRVFSDAVPLLERALGSRAGLGFVGKNTMLIKPKLGSFFFIAEILSNLIVKDFPMAPSYVGCKTCTNCLSDCPTKAIVAPKQVDARRCISYLSIEKRGILSSWEAAALGEWLFGCDICQEVCPFNHASLSKINSRALPEFESQAGVGAQLSLAELFNLHSNGDYQKRFAGTALLRTGRKGLLRNAACVAANTKAENLIPVLMSAAENDRALEVRWHAFGAALSLSGGNYSERLNNILNKLRPDVPPIFLEEL